jgi:hypothetical protein
MKSFAKLLVLGLAVGLSACAEWGDAARFERMTAEQTGIDFTNYHGESDSFNILTNEYIYNGGGVGIGDFDADGRPDIFFSGNAVPNRLYLNRGDWRFEDISAAAGIEAADRWCSGVTVVDINADGLDDIYVGATNRPDSLERANLLFINQGNGTDGKPTFVEAAAAYGLADGGHTTQAAWFDYDGDGDLDVFMINNEMVADRQPNRYVDKVDFQDPPRIDKLYRNDGVPAGGDHPVFSDVSREAGIGKPGFSLGLTICDINYDGRPDVYVTNDYLTNDLLYVNNGPDANGVVTFTDRAETVFKHTSYSAMGNDVVDLNNDGWEDIIAVDMLPADNYRRKTMLGPNNYTSFINNRRFGYQQQYVRNTLQLSQGEHPEAAGLPLYGETAMLAGIHATDWSWTPLVADFDQDGYRDVIITNGFPRDITDRDFIDYSTEVSRLVSDEKLRRQIPSVKLLNQAFRSHGTEDGQVRFDNTTTAWGITEESFSNGAAYVDLDGDGDLDYIVNNLEDPAHLYRNNSNEQPDPDRHYLRIALQGPANNAAALGARLHVYTPDGRWQTHYQNPYRGYLSSQEPVAHFGLGSATTVDSVVVFWPNGRRTVRTDLAADQVLTLEQPATGPVMTPRQPPRSGDPLLAQVSMEEILQEERDYIDFNVQPMLLRKLSQSGPRLAVADLNADGLDDFYLPGSFERSGRFFLQTPTGDFAAADLFDASYDPAPEEIGSLFFDADGDGDQDLYLVTGSYEFKLEDRDYRDRLFLNENGRFRLDTAALADIPAFSGSCVRATDYDGDGDLDLFVGGRVEPHTYPRPVSSYLLRNESGPAGVRFVPDNERAPVLNDIGLVCDAAWSDYDGDGRTDLVLSGDWLAPRFLRNTGERFEDASDQSGLGQFTGWWNCLTPGDFDADGDTDYVIGNFGLNTILRADADHPLGAYLTDLDENGTLDFIPSAYFPDEEGQLRHYPYFGRPDFAKQIVAVKGRHKLHAEYARAPMESYYRDPAEAPEAESHTLTARYLRSAYCENQGDGTFAVRELPLAAQTFPVTDLLARDLNGDGHLDLLLVGNDFGTEVSQGYMDAGNGLVLLGDGEGNFRSQYAPQSGWYVPGDAKCVEPYRGPNGEERFLVGQNQGPVLAFRPRKE